MDDWAAWNVSRYPVEDLIPYERNPRIHPQSQIDELAQSIREWGWTIPILIDSDCNVIAGHGRLYAAQQLGINEVPCVTADGWPEDKKRAYVIADNKLSENSRWDDGLFFSELKDLQNSGFDLSLVGFDEDVSFDFQPNLDPSTSYREITENDISHTAASMSDNLNRLTADRSLKGTEVVCPYCAESFTFDGI
ncbi:MAG: hypothetical protein CMF11_01930 [Idiomarina sp.]|nr:hypothetical protein [Idiomarina sp.]